MENFDQYIDALTKIKNSDYNIHFNPEDPLGALIQQISSGIKEKLEQSNRLFKLTEKINGGINLDDIGNHMFESFKSLIPFDRIGVACLDKNETIVKACWFRSDSTESRMTRDYWAPLQGSSLEKILQTGEPRILNDLEEYLHLHPHSHSTKLILEEGMKSSLTCPTYALGKPQGFVFFSSRKKNTYQNAHVGIFVQISNHLGMIVEKSRIMQRLQELDELKNQFLGIAAHDLRSPVNLIKYHINLWKEGFLGEFNSAQVNTMEIIERNCDRMRKLIDDLLDVSAIESGEMPIKKQPTDLVKLVTDYFENTKHLREEKSIRVKLEIDSDIPEIEIDKDRILQVIENYISNAIKYSNPGTEVIFEIKKSHKFLKITVTDQGLGIPEENLKKLFTKFGKAGVNPTGKEKSTGLGLFICKNIIKKHGGEVSAESKIGIGSTFGFTLPIS
ncbi:MAG: GAF domain-containing sensor histidine kinase [Candidatus Marinimicrobia bacterium]|nr:GAF domain-containing sensor histidine kinase [Candidatus Neomarinimicrobiota bacterium]